MRKVLLSFAILGGGLSVNAQLLQQDFQSSTTVASYVNATAPNNAQFNSISTSGTSTTVSIATTGTNNALRFNRNGGNAGSFSRTTDFANPNTLMYRLDLSVNGTVAATSAATFQVGSGFGTANTAESNANTYARFAVNVIANSTNFMLRDITNGVNSATLSGTQTILWVLNNSGATQTYASPLGADASVANDKADIWAGTTLLFDDVDVQTATQTMTDLKFAFSSGSAAIDVDNFLIDPIPATTAATAATGVQATAFTANWTPVAGVTGYRLDVSMAADFSSFVTGYQNLYVAGGTTSSYTVTGLSQGTTYYYRVRSASQYTVGEFASGNSNVQTQATGTGAPLPVKLASFKGAQTSGGIELQWSNLTESDVARYVVERSTDGRSFTTVATVSSVRNSGGAANYTQLDAAPVQGTNYYRLQIAELSGKVSYSGIVRITLGSTGGALDIYPNPLQGNVLGLQAGNLLKGNYSVKIISALGQVVDTKTLNHTGGSFSQTILLNTLKSGVYTLYLSGPSGSLQKQFIVR